MRRFKLKRILNDSGAIKISNKPKASSDKLQIKSKENSKFNKRPKGMHDVEVNSSIKVRSHEEIKKKRKQQKKQFKNQLPQKIKQKPTQSILTEQTDTDSKTNKSGPIKIDERVRQKVRNERFLTFRMYSYKLFNYLLKGSLDNRDPNLNGDSIQIGYANIFTKTTVTRYYVITFLPEDTPVGFMGVIIRALKRTGFWVNLSLQVKNKPYRVDFSATHLSRKIERWIRILEEDYQDVEGLDGNVYTRDFEMSKRRKRTARMFRSYYKLRENLGHNKESVIILKLQTREKEDMIVADSILRQRLQNFNIEFTQISGTLLDFLRAFSPVSKRRTVSNDTTKRLVMTTRDIVDLIPYRQGKIGDWGMWYGVDKFSGSNVWIDIMGTPKAKNILVMGLTGAGKSFFVSMILFFHHALKHNIFIHDHKGNEFTHFARSVGGVVISMTPSKTSYLSMWIMPVNEVDTVDELKALYTESFALAELEFLTLTEPEQKELKTYKNIFNDFFRFVHQSSEIYADRPETYIRSKNLTPNRLWELYESFYRSKPIIEVYGEKVLIEIANALFKYWHPQGSRNELYTNPIEMEEVLNSRVVCFDFGMAETTRNSVPDNELKLKKIFMNVASSRFTNRNKKKKQWTVKIVEEIQSADEDILKFTSQDITEGRAKNMINYVLGNATGTLTSGSQYAKNIIDNMNIQVLGKLYKDARDFYINQYNLHSMEKYLNKIANDQEYEHCFLLNCNITKTLSTAVVQMVATNRVAESKYFKTVDYEKQEA